MESLLDRMHVPADRVPDVDAPEADAPNPFARPLPSGPAGSATAVREDSWPVTAPCLPCTGPAGGAGLLRRGVYLGLDRPATAGRRAFGLPAGSCGQ